MGLRIQNNIAAMNAHRNLTQTDSMMSKSLERLSSGYRINKAADDAAGLAISSAFRADIASYKQASRNVSEANALAQVAEGAYDQVSNMLVRLKELATQASSANAGSNLDKINDEGNALMNEIDRIANATEYAGTKLLDGSFGVTVSAGGTITAGQGFISASGLQSGVTYNLGITAGSGTGQFDITVTATIGGKSVATTLSDVDVSQTAGDETTINFAALGLTLTVDNNFDSGADGGDIVANAGTAANFQVGAKNTVDDRVGISLNSVSTSSLSLNLNSMLTADDAQTFLTTIDNAINTLNDARGGIGAIQNRLGYAAANLSTTIENVQAAESVIRDVDMASEMTSFTKSQILMQAGTAMLAQANMAPQNILSLIG
ncbi:MAG: flagellin [Desulfobacteraceae bacterium]|jgi:flagellin